MSTPINIFWFRRDLRLDDNTGLYEALTSDVAILPIFIFDTEILEKLPKDDARVTFIHDTLQSIRKTLQTDHHSSLGIFHGRPHDVFRQLLSTYTIKSVFTNHDYEPYATQRDQEVKALLVEHDVDLFTYKDQVVFERNEVVKDDGNPYVVYTPYMRKWKERFRKTSLVIREIVPHLTNLVQDQDLPDLSLSDIGFERSVIPVVTYDDSSGLIKDYEATRNFPATDQTSRLGPHLRFGTVSVRKMVQKATAATNETFWNELIWREFFMQILWHFPHTVNKAFKPKYDRIEWRNDEEDFKRWCAGHTGYPLVDAGMRQLNQTGFMHNRVRMLVGSFLCKHLLIDWRWGEAYFAEKLHDYEMASNVGNWQWVAGCGVDAAPYFRIFNPTTQIKKFDADHHYIAKWVPDYQELTYPQPMVDHKMARERCLAVYKAAVS